jgi:hypothetical protein
LRIQPSLEGMAQALDRFPRGCESRRLVLLSLRATTFKYLRNVWDVRQRQPVAVGFTRLY